MEKGQVQGELTPISKYDNRLQYVVNIIMVALTIIINVFITQIVFRQELISLSYGDRFGYKKPIAIGEQNIYKYIVDSLNQIKKYMHIKLNGGYEYYLLAIFIVSMVVMLALVVYSLFAIISSIKQLHNKCFLGNQLCTLYGAILFETMLFQLTVELVSFGSVDVSMKSGIVWIQIMAAAAIVAIKILEQIFTGQNMSWHTENKLIAVLKAVPKALIPIGLFFVIRLMISGGNAGNIISKAFTNNYGSGYEDMAYGNRVLVAGVMIFAVIIVCGIGMVKFINDSKGSVIFLIFVVAALTMISLSLSGLEASLYKENVTSTIEFNGVQYGLGMYVPRIKLSMNHIWTIFAIGVMTLIVSIAEIFISEKGQGIKKLWKLAEK